VTLSYDASHAAVLPDPKTPDFYKFSGKQGDRLLLWTRTNASSATLANPQTVIDTVVTLYAPDAKTQLRENAACPRR
jgi:hypothetical protein